MARKTPRLLWPDQNRVAEAHGTVAIFALVGLGFIASPLSRTLIWLAGIGVDIVPLRRALEIVERICL
ncbi:MAG: hypothetical protein AAF160_19285 [Pseudomonadota bacterium]